MGASPSGLAANTHSVSLFFLGCVLLGVACACLRREAPPRIKTSTRHDLKVVHFEVNVEQGFMQIR